VEVFFDSRRPSTQLRELFDLTGVDIFMQFIQYLHSLTLGHSERERFSNRNKTPQGWGIVRIGRVAEYLFIGQVTVDLFSGLFPERVGGIQIVEKICEFGVINS
jgi:hypothetical protein